MPKDVAGANEPASAPALDGVTTDGRCFLVRDSRVFSRYADTDADAHAEDVWHTRYDGTEDVQR